MVGLPVATGSQQGGIFEAHRFVGAAFSCLGTTMNQPLPVRPYHQEGQPSSGWSGSDTSKEGERRRALAQTPTYHFIASRGVFGATRAETKHLHGDDGGPTSSALTNLHKVGLIARLKHKRNGHKVYVATEYIAGRATETVNQNKPKVCPHCGGGL